MSLSSVRRAGLSRAAGVWLLAAVLWTGGCATPGAPVVAERSATGGGPTPASYRVRRGDTLYSIAWRYALDYRQLAAINGVSAPFTIYPGQRLRLLPPAPKSVPSRPRAPSPAASPPAPPPPPASAWSWPAEGRVVRAFGDGNKGVDIELTGHATVHAAADGLVVYAGPGLGDFRTLVIIKHAGEYLSAYSFDGPTRLQEAEVVKARALVADIQVQGRSLVLHFEIRREGEPVSPRVVMSL